MFCDAESFCWYVIFFSFGQQNGYEVKSVWALGKIMRPQPLWSVYKTFSIELEVMAVHWTACTSMVFIHFWGYMKKHKAAAHVFPTCWRSIGPPLVTEWCFSGSGNVQNGWLYLFHVHVQFWFSISYFFKKTQNTKQMFTHFYTFLHICVSGFFGLHMCKWFFWLTHSYTSLHIHTHPSIRIQV